MFESFKLFSVARANLSIVSPNENFFFINVTLLRHVIFTEIKKSNVHDWRQVRMHVMSSIEITILSEPAWGQIIVYQIGTLTWCRN